LYIFAFYVGDMGFGGGEKIMPKISEWELIEETGKLFKKKKKR